MIQQQYVQANPDVAADVYQQAAAYQLGPFIAMYKPLLTNIFAIIGVVIGVIIADIILFMAILAATDYIIYILVAIPILAFGYGIYAIANHNLRVYHFSNGVVRAKGDQVDVIRWDQVESIWQHLTKSRYGSTSHHYTVRRSDGASFKFGVIINKVEILGQNMQQAITQQHTPMAIAAYNAGNTINFGSLTVSMQGLGNGKEVIPWNQVQSINVKKGYIEVKKVGKSFSWAKVQVRKTPNFLVFMRLVDYARTGRV